MLLEGFISALRVPAPNRCADQCPAVCLQRRPLKIRPGLSLHRTAVFTRARKCARARARARATAVVCDARAAALAHEGVLCARREEDPISATLKVITLIKAVMCGDGQAGEGGGRGGGGERRAVVGGAAIFFMG